MRVRAPGKVNLFLTVGPPGGDGYHPLVSVFQALSLGEEVTARLPGEGAELRLTVEGLHADRVPTDESNLALRAARLLAEHAGVDAGAHLHVRKGVPVAGGMAGGSADAAATLVALDVLWDLGLSRTELADLGATLGADVPFTLLGQTAIGSGRGDVLTPVLAHGTFHWAMAVRSDGLSTPEVFAEFDAPGGRGPAADGTVAAGDGDRGPGALDAEPDPVLLQALRAGDAALLGQRLHNDLHGAALSLAPDLAEVFAVAQDGGALGAVLSGSGPTVAVLARDAAHARALGAVLLGEGVADDVLYATGPVPGARLLVDSAPGA